MDEEAQQTQSNDWRTPYWFLYEGTPEANR
jgi:hypothetical protein